MAWKPNRTTAVAEAQRPVSERSLIASAINVDYKDLLSWRGYQLGRDEAWQRELWRLYDCIGEFRFGANWIGSACSRVAIGIYDTDENGKVGPRSEDPRMRALETTLLGGSVAQSEALRLMGINLTVAGELYVVGRSGRGEDDDKWYIVTPSELTRWAGGVMYDYGAGPMQLIDNVDVLFRVWTPHPRRVWYADSPARGVMNVLIEIERLTKYIFSQIDSRLVSAGLLPIPNDMDFPNEANEPDAQGAADTLMAKLANAGQASLKGEGSAVGVFPTIIEVPTEALGKIQLVNFASELSGQAKELREEAINRFAYGMDFPPEVLKGTGATNHWCNDIECLILTKNRGWVDESQLQIGEMVATLNHETGISEWQPVLDIYRADVVDEPMLRMESASHSSLSTAGHRWPIIKVNRKVKGSRRQWTTSGGKGFTHSDRVPVAGGFSPLSLPDAPKYTDSMIKLLAAYTSDGTLLSPPSYAEPESVARIAKFDEQEISILRSVMTDVFGENGFREHFHPTSSRDGVAFVLRKDETKVLKDLTGPDRMLTLDFVNSLTEAQLHLLLESMISIGDGMRSRSDKGYTFYQVKSHRLDALEMAGILLGYKVTRGRRNQQTGFGTEPLFWLTLSTARKVFSPIDCERTWENYTGRVWCPTTANGTWLAKRNGHVFYTGNSSWNITDQTIKIHIEPLMTRVCDAFTQCFLRPAVKKMGLDPKKYVFWFDTSGVVTRPNRLTDAVTLYDKKLLSAAAVREAGFFREDEAMPDDEKATIFMQDVILRDPTIFQSPDAREIAGISKEMLPPDAITPPPPPPPPGQTALPANAVGTVPQRPAEPPVKAVTASVTSLDLALIASADLAVRRALELAGGRLTDRTHRFPDTPKHELHTKIRVTGPDHAQRVLGGAWTHIPALVESISSPDLNVTNLTEVLDTYTRAVLITGQPHESNNLLSWLRKAGLVDG